ncbi:penicillin-binding protein 2 [Motiliproteus sp. MSK22-1]|uniref:penicillin-binding protein 2 n=1 Tax=Motiliproteus sp. MSK22-1 TaxID=1897630 RepID=UPI0009775B67|nr:penicillin-binding protein 2 [Motiliproteus sp. MSK22-1]OMH33730.1 penicillin-binding protein 2 [Motiliproteus sp. MSK22-1]
MRHTTALKDHHKERRTFTFRTLIAFCLVVLMMLGLVARMFYLQVLQYDTYRVKSDLNRVQLQPVAPTRGLIYDRNGVLLADNRPSHNLTLIKELVQDLDGVIARLAEVVDINDDDIVRFKRRLNQRRRPYQSVPLKFKLNDEEIARIAVDFHRLPGVRVEAELIRYYPYGKSLVHALGYVGRINERELKRIDAHNYSGTHHIGKLGVEKYYEDVLHGQVGMQKVETNARGRVLRVLERESPVPGKDLHLYLDLNLQLAAEKALGESRGAVVAMDPNTGGILALVSTPGYDPNSFVTGISGKDYRALQNSSDLPLFNRAIRGRYPPASTLKPFVGIAAVDSGTVKLDYTMFDPGFYQITRGGRKYRDWKRWGHGKVDLSKAITESVDTYFYDVGHRMGIDPMSDYLGRFGFGKVTSVDLPEAHGAILPSREWKKRSRNRPWYPGDSLNLSIGQGFMVATPLQLATAAMTLANRGKWWAPRMLQTIANDDSFVVDVPPEKQLPDVKLTKDEYWDYMTESMEKVIHASNGTARRIGKGLKYRIAGKTGTAQVVGIKQDERYDAEALSEKNRDHALFIGFAPVESPKIVLSVIVENTGGGSSAAAPVARKVFDTYLLGHSSDDEAIADVGGGE